MPSAKSWIFYSRLSCTWSIHSKGFCTNSFYIWLHYLNSVSSSDTKFGRDYSNVDSIVVPYIERTYSNSSSWSSMNVQSYCNFSCVVITGTLDGVFGNCNSDIKFTISAIHNNVAIVVDYCLTTLTWFSVLMLILRHFMCW